MFSTGSATSTHTSTHSIFNSLRFFSGCQNFSDTVCTSLGLLSDHITTSSGFRIKLSNNGVFDHSLLLILFISYVVISVWNRLLSPATFICSKVSIIDRLNRTLCAFSIWLQDFWCICFIIKLHNYKAIITLEIVFYNLTNDSFSR